jgi:hypothetical protein
MISVNRVISPSLQKSYVARNGGNGLFAGLASGQASNGKGKVGVETNWLVTKGATASGKNLSELWDTYLISKGFTTGPLKDRMKAFFRTGTQA